MLVLRGLLSMGVLPFTMVEPRFCNVFRPKIDPDLDSPG